MPLSRATNHLISDEHMKMCSRPFNMGVASFQCLESPFPFCRARAPHQTLLTSCGWNQPLTIWMNAEHAELQELSQPSAQLCPVYRRTLLPK